MPQVFTPKSKQKKSAARRWRSLCYALTAPSIISNFQGRQIFVDPKDRRSRKIFIRRDVTERPDLATWLKLFELSAWTDVVDVGANYGEFLVAIEHPETYAITAFEPNPKVFELLSRTCSANHLNIKLENVAVSDRKGEARFYVSSLQSGASSIIENHTVASHSVVVPQVALGDYFSERYGNQISSRKFLVKIDIEGHDLVAIRGLGQIIEKAADLAVMFEINHVGAADLMQLLDRFDIFVLGQAGKWLAVKPPITAMLFQTLRSAMGFDDAVLVRNTSNSGARSALISLVE